MMNLCYLRRGPYGVRRFVHRASERRNGKRRSSLEPEPGLLSPQAQSATVREVRHLPDFGGGSGCLQSNGRDYPEYSAKHLLRLPPTLGGSLGWKVQRAPDGFRNSRRAAAHG